MHARQEQLGKKKLLENTKRIRMGGEWVLKYINTGIHPQNVILRVTVLLFNHRAGILGLTRPQTPVPFPPRVTCKASLAQGSHRRTRACKDGSQCLTSGLFLLVHAVPQICQRELDAKGFVSRARIL